MVPAACFVQEDLEPPAVAPRGASFDRTGPGRSAPIPPDMPVTFASEFEDIDAIRAHLGLERFALMGWSYMGLVAGLYASDHPDALERLLLSGAMAPRNLALSELPPELERQRQESLRRRRERVDADAVRQLEEAHATGQWTDEASYCREHRRLSGPRQFGRPEAMLKTKADPCDLPNEWPGKSAELMQRIFASLAKRGTSENVSRRSAHRHSSCTGRRISCSRTRRASGPR